MSRKKKPEVGIYNIKTLLETHIFSVPEYQRAYSWSHNELNDLFNDVLEGINKNEEIFMSLIVGLLKEKTKIGLKEYRCVDLVDGQQRITTIVLLLKAIYLVKKELGIVDFTVEDLLIKKDVGMTRNVISQGAHKSSTILQNYIVSGTLSPSGIDTFAQRNLKNAIDECYGFIKYIDYNTKKPSLVRDIATIDSIKELLLNNFKLVYYELPEEKDVYKTFESLNSRGLPVAALDNFKSQLIGIAFASNDTDAVRELHNLWTDIYNTIGEESINEDDIITITATLFKANDDTKSTPKSMKESMEYLYNIAMKKISYDNVPAVLKHADPSLDTQGYRCQQISILLKRTASEMVDIHKNRKMEAITDVKQARVLLIAIRLSEYDDDEKNELLLEWEKTTFRLYCLHRKDSRSFKGEYINCATEAIANIPFKELQSRIKNIGSKFTFNDGLRDIKESNWYPDYNNDVIYVLRRYDEYLSKAAGVAISESSWNKIWDKDPSTTIEHIFPKTYPKQEPQLSTFKTDWAHGGKQFSQKKLNKFVHNIGNLTVLEPGVNSKAGQKSYSEKIALYGGSMRIHPEANSKYLKKGFWTEQSIKERESDILEFIKNTWE